MVRKKTIVLNYDLKDGYHYYQYEIIAHKYRD